jgi:DNA-directed RNA polymerase sigma subunit (sigma70/sigma32)
MPELLKASGLEAEPLLNIIDNQILRVLGELTCQKEKVLKLRYGIEDELTLQQIGNIFGLIARTDQTNRVARTKKMQGKSFGF